MIFEARVRRSARFASRIVRQASCSVLIVPNLIPREALSELPEGKTDVLSDSRLWSNAWRESTARNAGRIVNLEVADPKIGALVEVTRYATGQGVSFGMLERSIGTRKFS